MAYTTINKSTDYFNTKLYTGTGSSNAITGVGFQPDFTWLKKRSASGGHYLTDAVRGVTKTIYSDGTDAEGTVAQALTAFGADGFTVGTDSGVNANTYTFASWNWKSGTTSGITTNGSTDTTPSSYSFNQTAGISIVKYSGSGSTPTKIAHGLGVAPKMIIVKRLTGTADWVVGHNSMADDWTKYIYLSSTAASVTAGGAAWENTAPDTVNFTVGDNTQINASGSDYIAYCFAEKTGYSKFGSYTGNGNADGTFVYTGFKPAFVMIKSFSDSSTWHLADNKRIGYNPLNYRIQPNNSNAEYQGFEIYSDFLSNGFKLRNTDTDTNGSGRTYIYMAFGQSMVGTNNVPATAR